jgi:hypothetical protein
MRPWLGRSPIRSELHPPPVHRFLPELIDLIRNRQIDPGQGLRPHP